jgi:LCP family protein required for cell wall assembly
MQRINTAYLYGQLDRYPGRGPGLLRDTIRYNLGIRIDYMAMVDFSGFRRIVDRLGGIDLPMACPYTDWRLIDPSLSDQLQSNWRLYTIGPGVVHMNGELALWYARSRLRSTDFDRGRRQQEVLRAILDRALQFDIVPMLPQLWDEFGTTVTTDLSLSDLMGFAPLALNLKDASIRSYYIHSRLVKSWRTPEGASVQIPKGEKIKNMLMEALSPPDASEITNLLTVVEVVNASGKSGNERLAAERLHYAGFATEYGEPLSLQSKTRLYDLTSAQDPNRSAALLTIFGLPQSRLQPATEPKAASAYRLVIGSDFDPCFNPIQLVH